MRLMLPAVLLSCSFLSGQAAIAINDGDIKNAATEGVIYLDAQEVTFSGVSEDIGTVGTLYFGENRTVSSRTQSNPWGGPDAPEEELPSTLGLAAGKSGRIWVEQGALLSVKASEKTFSAAADATLFLQGNMRFYSQGSATGGAAFAHVYLAGDTVGLLDNGALGSNFTVEGSLYVGSSSGALSRLEIGSKSSFQVGQSGSSNGLHFYGGTTLALKGNIGDGHAIFSATNLYIGDFAESGLVVDVGGITGMNNGDSFVLIGFTEDIWDSSFVALTDSASMQYVADAITFVGSDFASYSVAWDDSLKNLVVTYNAVPEPSTCAAVFGAFVLAFAAYRRKRK